PFFGRKLSLLSRFCVRILARCPKMAYHPAMAQRKKKSTRKSSPRRKKRGNALRDRVLGLARLVLVMGMWAVIALTGLVAWYALELPSIIEKPGFERKPAITVKDINGDSFA